MGRQQPTRTCPPCTTTRRRPRARKCLGKGCGRRYTPRCWRQRYCQNAECLRMVRRWQAARRQRRCRASPEGRRRHRQAERARRQEAKAKGHKPKARSRGRGRGHATKRFWSMLCGRPGCYEAPRSSVRAPARYCSKACRCAVRRVEDRERKWLSRRTLAGRMKRHYEYEAARRRHVRRPADPSHRVNAGGGATRRRCAAAGRTLSARPPPGEYR